MDLQHSSIHVLISVTFVHGICEQTKQFGKQIIF